MSQLYLASQSPRRRELLAQIGVPFQCLRVDVPEQHQSGESPEAYVRRLAASKAEAGVEQLKLQGVQGVVLGADTIVHLDGDILEKPRDAEHSFAMLNRLSGRTHSVLTALCLTDGVRERTVTSTTSVYFRPLSESEIRAYWQTGEPQDKAGSYGIQGLGAIFVDAIAGSYSNVVGLGLESLKPLLDEFDLPYWQLDNKGDVL